MQPTVEISSKPDPRTDITNVVLSTCRGWGLDSTQIIALHGSRIEGFGNAGSDVDFYVISPQGAAPPLLPVFEWASGYRLQPDGLSWEAALSLASRLNAITPKHVDAVMSLTPRDIGVYYRVSTSVGIGDRERINELKAQFSTAHSAALFACRTGVAAQTELKKASMFAEYGDGFEEYHCLRRAVEYAVDSHLATQGEAYPIRKWRFEKLARCFGTASEIYRAAWQLKALGDTTLASYRHAARELVRTLVPDYCPQPVFPSRIRNGSAFSLSDEQMLLVPSTAVYTLGSCATQVWSLIDGRMSSREIAERVAADSETELSEASYTVNACMTAFRSHGLVDVMPVFD